MPGMGRLSVLGCRLAVNLLLAIGIVFFASAPACALQVAVPDSAGQPSPVPGKLGTTQSAQPATSSTAPRAQGGTSPIVQTPDALCEAAGQSGPAGERQIKICQHTQQLHELAIRLQSAVNRSNKDMLSVDVLRLSEQIQILAHQIQVELKQP